MIYGLYLSATGVLANSYRQDVIANNLANSETVGFKRDLTPFQQRLTEAQQRRLSVRQNSNGLLEGLGGGLLVSPTAIDTSQGELESTGNPLDLALHGDGYFMVRKDNQVRLTRDGRFMVDRRGRLITADGNEVLDEKRRPITLETTAKVSVGDDGVISQNSQEVARLGVVGVPDRQSLYKLGDNLFAHPQVNKLLAGTAAIRSQFVERSNVDPTVELTRLMEVQRQIEANANMIRYQDQTLGRLVNEVGKIG